MTPGDRLDLLDLFDGVAVAVEEAVGALADDDRRARTGRGTQYVLDLAADEAALALLHKAPVKVVSEESGESGDLGSDITVVLDPVDGSANCSRRVPYWSTSVAAVDGDGLLAGLVVHQVTGERFHARRGGGAWVDGDRVASSGRQAVSGAMVGTSGMVSSPPPGVAWRSLGSAALEIASVGAGVLDGYVDVPGAQAPWDYLAGALVCREAGAPVDDADGRELVVTDWSARRRVVAAATPELWEPLAAMVRQ